MILYATDTGGVACYRRCHFDRRIRQRLTVQAADVRNYLGSRRSGNHEAAAKPHTPSLLSSTLVLGITHLKKLVLLRCSP